MALEFICSDGISQGKRIKIPGGANYYNRKCKKKIGLFKEQRNPVIRFFRVNPKGPASLLEIPEKAEYIEFPNFEEYAYHIHYGNPVFYDENGKVLECS